MAKRAFQLDKAHPRAGSVQRAHEAAAFGGGLKPIRREGDKAEPALHPGKGPRQIAAMRFGQIEIIHGAGDIEIGVGIEALDEAEALVAQIGLDLEICIKPE